MQRVRIGLTGLACVFLLVLLAAAFFGLTNDERETGSLASAPATAAANSIVGASPREPLAELGVAPGYSTDSAAGNAASPAAAPPVAPAPPPVGAPGRVPPSPPAIR